MRIILFIFLGLLFNLEADEYVKKQPNTYDYELYLKKLENKKGTNSLGLKYKFGAQISYDAAYIDSDPLKYESARYRRVRINNEGSLFNDKLLYEIEYSLTGNNHYKDIYIANKGKIKPLGMKYRVKLGNIKVPFSLESYSSSKYISFMERSLGDTFCESRKLGAEFLLSKKIKDHRINLFGALLSNSVDERRDKEVEKQKYVSRLTYGYKFEKNHLLHLGGSFIYTDANRDTIQYSQLSESDMINDKYVSVKVKDVDNTKKYALETLYINDRFSFQSEYFSSSIDSLVDSYNFEGYYLQGSYFILGSGKKFKRSTSTLSKIKPNKDGAVELAFRYSHVDLNDKDEAGGIQDDISYGVNYYVSKELKFMLNYVLARPQSDRYDGQLQILQARALFAF